MNRLEVGDVVRDEFGIGTVTHVTTRSIGILYDPAIEPNGDVVEGWSRSVVTGTPGHDRLVVIAHQTTIDIPTEETP